MVADPLKMPRFANTQPLRIDFRTRGSTGLKSFAGFSFEEGTRALQGVAGINVFREMGDNDAVCSTILYLADKVVRQVPWRVERVSDHPRDRAAAKFLEQCMDDLDSTWEDFISEVMTMLQYGFSLHEIVYKRRCGSAPEPFMNSRYSDGRIGWRGMPIRAQETIYRWLTDDLGNMVSVEQIAPPVYQPVNIPMEKLLLFRTSTHKNNPLGRSVFRGAYKSWMMKRGIENIEGVGVERDLAGLPVALVPPEVLAGQTPETAGMLTAIKEIITNIRRDEQEGVIFPMAYDPEGRPMFELKLLSSGGTRQFDTSAIISRYDSRIAMCGMADFILLGQAATAQGSWAMHSDKTKMYAQSITAFLDIIASTLNRFAVRRLFELNAFAVDEYPELVHDAVEGVDLKAVGEFLRNVTAAGAAIFPNASAEARLCEMAGLPAAVAPATEEPAAPVGKPQPKDVEELHDGDPDPVLRPGETPMPGSAVTDPTLAPGAIRLPTRAATGRV